MENPPKDYFRLSPGKEVRLKNAYIIKCDEVKKDSQGNITEILCTYDPETKSGMPQANRKVKGTLHWVSAHDCIDAEVRLYDRLFMVENTSDDERDFRTLINPDSKRVLTGCKLEPCLQNAKVGKIGRAHV